MIEASEKWSGWAINSEDLRIVHVTEVKKGRKCGCLCPSCKSPLIAKQGDHRVWHFAHAVGENACPRAAESGLHLAAKEILRTLNGRIFIPEETMRKDNWPTPEDSTGVRSETRLKLDEQMTHIVPERQLSGSSVRIEPTDWKDYGFQPDAVFENDKGKLLVEIRVTHGVDEEKRARIQKTGLGAIEIDLSETPRNVRRPELVALVISKAPRMWITTSRPEKQKKMETQFNEILKHHASRLNQMNLRKLNRKFMVNACPRKDESDFFSVHYNACRKCEHHGGTEGDFDDTPLWNLLDERIRLAAGSFVLCAHRDGSDKQPTEKQRDFVRVLARDDLRPEGGLKLPSGWDEDLDFCREFIEAHPPCHKCRNGVRLTLRRNRKNKTLFWGCMEYPYCREYKLYVYRAVLEELLALHDIDQNCDADPRRGR